MRIIGAAMTLISLGAGATHCSTAQAVQQPRPHQTIFISMTYDVRLAPIDARPGDTLNVIIDPGAPDVQNFCDHRGGSLWINPFTGVEICENIDF